MASRFPPPFEDVLVFGPYQLSRGAKTLRENGQQVPLNDALFSILTALVERAGEVVSNEELSAHVWPPTYSSHATTGAYVRALCRRLGVAPNRRAYISGRLGGYCFTEPVNRKSEPTVPALRIVSPRRTPQVQAERLVGREADVETVASLVEASRFVTLTGPRGIGKSALALVVAERLMDYIADGACLVELASVADPAHLATAVAEALGVQIFSDDSVPVLSAALRGLQVLIVLDDCAAVAEAVPAFVEKIMAAAPQVRFLATATAPLHVTNEATFRVAGLAQDADGCSPATDLLVQRRLERVQTATIADMDLYQFAGFERRADGMPLAIELIAGGSPPMLQALAPRSGAGSSQSLELADVLAWVFDAIAPDELRMMRQLSMLSGAFDLKSVHGLAAPEFASTGEMDQVLNRLVAMGLVSIQVQSGVLRYRIHVAVREYVVGSLTDRDELVMLRRRHARFCQELLRIAEEDWKVLERDNWLARYGKAIHDVRKAIDWCLASPDDRALGVALTAAAIPMAVQLSLFGEFRERARKALEISDGWTRAPVLHMRLNTAYANLTQLTWGSGTEAAAAFARAHELAERLGIASEQGSTLLGVWALAFGKGNYPAAAEYGNRLSMVAKVSSEPFLTLLADRISAQALHFLGDHARAKVLAERVINYPARHIPFSMSMPGVSRQVSMRIVLARILWMQGLADQAADMAEAALTHARSDVSIAVCHALALAACPIALWRGENERARELAEALRNLAAEQQASYWGRWSAGFEDVLAWRSGGERRTPSPDPKIGDAIATFADVFVTPQSLARVEGGLVGWCAPEVLRAQGEKILADAGDRNAAGDLFRRAIALARHQSVPAWELRAAMSLVRLTGDEQARSGLKSLLAGFVEGRDTADFKAAEHLARDDIGIQVQQ